MKQENLKKIIDLRHELHRHPELSLQEAETKKRIRGFLETHTQLAVVEQDGWLYAVKEGTDPQAGSIAFRADMDALPIAESEDTLLYASCCPGVSHKCGHDGHCAALCGFALELEALQPEKTVYLIFQCAEEIAEGAKKAVRLIIEKTIGEIYAFHNLSGYPEGEILYRKGVTQPASLGVTFCFEGRSSHASAPEEGTNPSAVIAKTVLFAEQYLKTNQREPSCCTVVGMESGTGDFGISAGEGRLMFTLRDEKEERMNQLLSDICSYAANASSEAGLSFSHCISDYFPETKNSEAGIEKVIAAARALRLPVREMERMWKASEDFGYYMQACGGAMFYVGNGESWPPLHTKDYDFNDCVLETAVDLFCKLIG